MIALIKRMFGWGASPVDTTGPSMIMSMSGR